jgi:hypothetical protein
MFDAAKYILKHYNDKHRSEKVKNIVESNKFHPEIHKYKRRETLRSLGNKTALSEFKKLQTRYSSVAQEIAKWLDDSGQVEKFAKDQESS